MGFFIKKISLNRRFLLDYSQVWLIAINHLKHLPQTYWNVTSLKGSRIDLWKIIDSRAIYWISHGIVYLFSMFLFVY